MLEKKNLAFTGIRTPAFQPAARRYTDSEIIMCVLKTLDKFIRPILCNNSEMK
jgi:hypothetical protein